MASSARTKKVRRVGIIFTVLGVALTLVGLPVTQHLDDLNSEWDGTQGFLMARVFAMIFGVLFALVGVLLLVHVHKIVRATLTAIDQEGVAAHRRKTVRALVAAVVVLVALAGAGTSVWFVTSQATTQALNARFVDFRSTAPTTAPADPFQGKFIYYDEQAQQFDLSAHGADAPWSTNPDEITVIISYREKITTIGTYHPTGGGSGSCAATQDTWVLSVHDVHTGEIIDTGTLSGNPPPSGIGSCPSPLDRIDLGAKKVHDYVSGLFAR